MKRCIICGAECDNYICETCAETVDLETVCMDLVRFKPDECTNELWCEMAGQLEDPYRLRNIAFEVAKSLPSPRRQYVQILSIANNGMAVKKDNRSNLYDLFESCHPTESLSQYELNRVRGLVIDALYKDYRYQEAERIVDEIVCCEDVPAFAYVTVADYYTVTRRYDESDAILAKAGKCCGENTGLRKVIDKCCADNMKRRENREKGKKEYLPNPKENKEEIQQRYLDFLHSIGIETETFMRSLNRVGSGPSPIKRDRYPDSVFTYDPCFDSFVSFDLETTGLSAKYNSIIEIGAIKVVAGEIIETKEFTFQEFVKPFRSKLTEEVEKLTGITLMDLMFARQMWEVFPDFMNFVGDNILLGYNCNRFDSRFMTRAGRYSHIVIQNPYFDVMLYAEKFRKQLGITSRGISLGLLSDKLGIANPDAHRALADAITTARVFLELKRIDS